MKTKIINVSLALTVGLIFANCDNQKTAETNNVKVVCDSVNVPEYDANGVEYVVKKLRCDTIKEKVNK